MVLALGLATIFAMYFFYAFFTRKRKPTSANHRHPENIRRRRSEAPSISTTTDISALLGK